jgi:hypothetical protein
VTFQLVKFIEYIKALVEKRRKVAHVVETEPLCVKEKRYKK